METKKAESKKPNILQKMKEKIPDRQEQFEYISIAVRLLVVFWSGALVTLNYLPKIPGLTSGEKQDITFPASLLSSSLLSFGLEKAAKGKEDKEKKKDIDAKTELKEILGNTQLIRIETPVKLVPMEPRIDPITGKTINDQGKLS